MENLQEIIGYKIVDNIKNCQVGKDYKIDQKRRARSRCDKMDNEYGAYRYFVKPIYKSL